MTHYYHNYDSNKNTVFNIVHSCIWGLGCDTATSKVCDISDRMLSVMSLMNRITLSQNQSYHLGDSNHWATGNNCSAQRHKSRRKGAREGGQISRPGKGNKNALEGWSQSDTHHHWHFANNNKRSGGKPENTGNNDNSWIHSASRTPRKSTNTKEGTGAWLKDSESQREKAVC